MMELKEQAELVPKIEVEVHNALVHADCESAIFLRLEYHQDLFEFRRTERIRT